MRKLKTQGQYLTEYAVVLTVSIAAIVGVQIYVQRSLQARFKQGVDYSLSQGTQTNLSIRQYEPYYAGSEMTETRNSDITGGFPEAAINQTTQRQGWQKIGPAEDAD